jgi:phage-related protein
MAGPGGKEVGRVNIRVLPDTSKFGPSLQAYLERTERRLRLNLPVSLDQGDAAAVEAELAELTRDREVNIDIDTNDLEKNLTRVTDAGSRGFGRMGLVIGAVTIAVGTLAAALPAMLAILGAPILAIIAGFDGIKNAAKGLTDEVDHLRDSVSEVFERLLTPGFERLAKLFPVLEDGLGKVAEGIAEIFDSFSTSITSTEALKTIGDIFDRIGKIFQDFARLGGMDAFVDSILALADAGTKASLAITPEFVATFTEFNDQLERMSKNGDLQKGMEGIGHAIEFVLILFGELVLFTIESFAVLERTGEAISNFFSKTVPEGVAAMRTQIVADFNGLLAYVRGIPGTLASYFSHLGSMLYTIGANAVQGLWDGMKSKFGQLTSWLSQKASEILGVFSGLWNINSPSREFRKLGLSAGEGLSLGFEDSLKDVTGSAELMAGASLQAANPSTMVSAEPSANGGLNRSDLDYLAGRIATLMGIATDGAISDQLAFSGRMARA